MPVSSSPAASICPVCQHDQSLLVSTRDRYGDPLRTVACLKCGLYRNDPLPTIDELKTFHAIEYRSSYQGARDPRPRAVLRSRRLAARRISDLNSYLPVGGHILDAGSGSGEFLAELRAHGYRPQGLEADGAYAAYARRRYEVPVESRGLLEPIFAPATFDAITMFHVLEHQPDPIAVLRHLGRWLKPGGAFIIEVPNLDSPHQHPAKRFHYAHVIGFTRASLRMAAHQAGFSVVSESTSTFDRNLRVVLRPGASAAPSLPAPTPLVTSPRAIWSYYTTPQTYTRFFRRMGQFFSEYLATSKRNALRAIALILSTLAEILPEATPLLADLAVSAGL